MYMWKHKAIIWAPEVFVIQVIALYFIFDTERYLLHM